jgi:hypothetical protein
VSLPDAVMAVRSTAVAWARHIAHLAETRHSSALVEKFKGVYYLGCWAEDGGGGAYNEKGDVGQNLFHVAQDVVQWRTLGNSAMNVFV